MSEYRSAGQYRQQRALKMSGDIRNLVCFCVDTSGSMTQSLRIKRCKQKIDLLSEVLKKMIFAFQQDPFMRHAVAISIVTYNKFAKEKESFQDAFLYEDLKEICKFHEVDGSTNMTSGLTVSLRSINDCQRMMMESDQNTHTPLLVFLTDGEPVEPVEPDGSKRWVKKFKEVRDMVAQNRLHVFPVGIGKEAKMSVLKQLFPDGKEPQDFENKYCMVEEDDFERVFSDIRKIVYLQSDAFADEERSAPAVEDIQNSQGGVDLCSFLFEGWAL